MNKYVNLKRVEFLVTERCTSRCIHCSNSSKTPSNTVIGLNKAKQILNRVSEEYRIESVMTFGGEPLIYPGETIEILKYAKDIGIPTRQLITNGYWSNKREVANQILDRLKEAEVNDILLSVDYFHQEFLDFSIIEYVVSQFSSRDFSNVRLHPCWYQSPEGDNPYDDSTRNYLQKLKKYHIPVSCGNTLFPSGRAIESFPELFIPLDDISQISCSSIPYTERPDNIESICINPDGLINSLCLGHKMEVDEFLTSYNPFKDEKMKLFLEKGVSALYKDDFDLSQFYSVCNACRALREV